MKIQRKTFLSPALALLGLVSGPAALKAQLVTRFEWVYGNNLFSEQALKGAVPVQICPGGGYVSVGFTRRTGLRTDSDVYFVHIAENGMMISERTFDLVNRLG